MIKFIKFILAIALLIISMMFLAAVTYDYVYINNSTPRNKTQHVIQLENQNFDYVFLGSSRVENHINNNLIKQKLNKDVINLGISGANLSDNLLLLKVFIQNNKCKELWLQLDYMFNTDNMSDIVGTDILPYIYSNNIVSNHIKTYNDDYLYLKYIPFYKYMSSDYKIGFREFYFNLISKKVKYNLKDGFIPKEGNYVNNNFKLPTHINDQNNSLNEIITICAKEKIKLVLFTAPFSKNTENISYIDSLKSKFPNLKDYSRLFDDNKYFKDKGHLNFEGANLFTETIIQDLE